MSIIASSYGSPDTATPTNGDGAISTGTVNSIANAAAANGGWASADASAVIIAGGTGSVNSFAFANSTGGDALSETDIVIIDGGAPAPGVYWDAYASGDSFAVAFLLVPTPNSATGFTFTNAGSSDAFASIDVEGSSIFVAAGAIVPE